MPTKIIECHACGEECHVKDKYNEIDLKSIKYCPFCGDSNIEVTESKNS